MWSQVTLVTDADLGGLEPQAIASGRPWGRDSWPDQIAEAMKDLRVWIDLAYADIVSASDRVIDRWNLDWVTGYNGVTYGPDVSAQARDDNERDVAIGAILTDTSARIIVGARYQFDGVFVKVDVANTEAATLVVEYFGANGWTVISTVDDGTAVNGVPFARSGRIAITPPADWEAVRLNQGSEFLWLRLGVTAAVAVGTTATQITAIRPPLALKRVAVNLAMAYVKRGCAQSAGDPELWLKSADDYERKARDLFSVVRDAGIPLDVDRTGAISPDTHERTESSPVRMYRG